MMSRVYLIDGARTAFTAFGGSFSTISATKLGTITAKEAIRRSNIDPEQIDHVIYGNVIHSQSNAAYISRHISLNSDIPKKVPALSLNRLCGSGLQAIVSGVQEILLNDADLVLAGGVENMSQAPFSNFEQRFGKSKYGDLTFTDMLQATLTDEYTGAEMGITAENLAEKYEITREEQDEFAVLSHERAHTATERERFAEEIVPVEVKKGKKTIIVEKDEHIRAETKIEKLRKLPTVFKKDGTVTAGNSSGINDGAASVVIGSEKAVKTNKLKPAAEIISWAVAGVEPHIMGIGPVPAIKKALKKANLTLSDMDLVEVNEPLPPSTWL